MPLTPYPVLQVSDYGSKILATIRDGDDGDPVNVTGYTITFRFLKPSGTTSDKSGSIVSGAGGVVQYILESGLIDEAGAWRWQILLTNGTVSVRTEIKRFDVIANL
jgi:hypothetical protein